MISIVWIFLRTWHKEILMVILIGWGEYWHVKALNYENTLLTINQNSAVIEASLQQSIEQEDAEKLKESNDLKMIRNAKVSPDCYKAMDWMRRALIEK